jgi:hypothetical protein
MRNPRGPLAPALIGACLLLTALVGPASGRSPARTDRVEDCEEVRPDALDVAGVTDDGSEVTLDVLVLLDGVDKNEGKAIFDEAATSYSPLGVELVPRMRSMSAAPTTSQTPSPYVEPVDLIASAKEFVGTVRPKGIDVVYVLTSRDLGTAADPSVTGYADCIGGIRYPDRSFAVGEAKGEPLSLGVNIYKDVPAKVAAHEIGHLLGARHEHQSCAEGLTRQDVDAGEATPCTVMTNYVELQSLNFGALEGAIVRGHATRYAAP